MADVCRESKKRGLKGLKYLPTSKFIPKSLSLI